MLKVQLREGMIQQNFLRRSIAMLSMRTFFIQSCALESHLLGQGRPSSNGCGAGTAGHCRRRLKQYFHYFADPFLLKLGTRGSH